MANFHVVPILDVSTDNCRDVWPAIALALKSSTFVAIDMELSGLGNRKQLNARSMDDRYAAICDVAKSRSVLSVGLSCFKLQSVQTDAVNSEEPIEKDPRVTDLEFQVQTFNVMTLCSEEYMVDPVSLKFLVHHGFDFNKQYAKGIPYFRGPDRKAKECKMKEELLMRDLLNELVRSEVPVVFHNGLVDLVFLYHSFYATLPEKMSTFLADLSEMFPLGIFDTKYITEFKARFPASYLEYVFRRCQRENFTSSGQQSRHINISYLKYPDGIEHMNYLPCGVVQTETSAAEKERLCTQFANHGWCAQGESCPKSHDVDKILDNEQLPHMKRRRKRKRNSNTTDNVNNHCENSISHTKMELEDGATDVSCNNIGIITSDGENKSPECNTDVHSSRTEGHRAGFDAFMTGFVFAQFMCKHGRFRNLPSDAKLTHLGMTEFQNRVALSGKDIPLQIVKSNFAKTSKDHCQKLPTIKS